MASSLEAKFTSSMGTDLVRETCANRKAYILKGTFDNAIREFSKQGFEIVYNDATTCQLKQGKRFRGWQVIGVGVLTLGLSVVPHALQQAGKKDKIILLNLDAKGGEVPGGPDAGRDRTLKLVRTGGSG